MERTHASFFSGVGGLDLGLERAGWHTVSFSEIDPYASAVLAERWPGVPNLGDIVDLAVRRVQPSRARAAGGEPSGERHPYATAVLWTGGFPCQDLSVAGKRRGMGTEDDRTRSGLAYAFLDLVERHRPPAILLENVPGLLSSNAGKDFGALLGRLGELGYWWAYRVFDAQFFGVPQRRRRVFICALHAGAGFGADSAAAVLSVGARCGGHSATSDEAGEGAAGGVGSGPIGTLREHVRPGSNTDHTILSPSLDSGGVREADGVAGGSHDREVVGTLVAPDTRHSIRDGKRQDGSRRDRIPVTLAPTLRVGPARPQDGGPGDTVPIIVNALDQQRGGADDNSAQANHLVGTIREHVRPGSNTDHSVITDGGIADDPLLPLGLDSHRYRCCGNGVVSNVSEWIGVRLARAVQEVTERAA